MNIACATCSPVRRAYRVEGLDCVEEVRALKETVGLLDGVESLSFDLIRARMVVTFNEGAVSEAKLLAAVKRAGMRAQPFSAAVDGRSARSVSMLVAGVATAVGLTLELSGRTGVPAFVVGVVAGMWFVLPKAIAAARRLRPDMNLLMAVAVAGAAAIGEWFEASTVSYLFALSLALEAWSVRRARHAIDALLDLAPPTARLLRDGGEEEVPAGEVVPHSLVRVFPGERIPLDGVVEAGAGAVDESLLTGESLPVAKEIGSEVVAGSINGEGTLDVRTTKSADESTIAHITRLVEEAGQRGSRSERWVERFAARYTPIVMVCALLAAVMPPLVAGVAWGDAVYRALVLLVIACPCALVISTPVSIVSALAAAARNGVLVKEGAFLELPARLRTVAFDKTGTITKGRPRVVELVGLEGYSEQDLLTRAAAVESGSEHPLAGAILDEARKRGLALSRATNVRAVPGRGAEGTFESRTCWVGSPRWLEERELATPESRAQLERLSVPGRSVMVVGDDRRACGLIAVADEIRPEAARAIADLRQAGVRHVVMLTGDSEATARAVAARVGIEDVRAELLPEDKIAIVEALRSDGDPVAMVGDGVNDAPALAMADIGIAMAAAGSDTAIETADVALMTSDLTRLAWLVRHSRRTLSILRQNIIGALCIKVIFVLLTFAGFTALWMAIAADMGASLAVVFNALRLLKARQPERTGMEGS